MGKAGTRNRRYRCVPAGTRQTHVICKTTSLTCPQHGLLTSRTIQAHCTFLPPPDLARLAEYGTSVAHCPLSNAYFSAEPFRLREALNAGVKVGFGTDIAGGYSVDIMQAMRQAVVVSRMREGQRIMQAGGESNDHVSIDWKDALHLATAGGAAAMGLPNGVGTFAVGSPFDAQHSESSSAEKNCIDSWFAVRIRDAESLSVGPVEFFDTDDVTGGKPSLTEEHVEKWWCLGDSRNRVDVWVQGRKVWPEGNVL